LEGENVSTSEVEQAFSSCPGVLDLVVYGVNVRFADGRAGMAAIVVSDAFDLDTFYQAAKERLAAYARPIFLRICAGIEATPTFKPRKGALVEDGIDPSRTTDIIYVADPNGSSYKRLDKAVYERLQRGELRFELS
jgi:fatty-acyl-CoA synthase